MEKHELIHQLNTHQIDGFRILSEYAQSKNKPFTQGDFELMQMTQTMESTVLSIVEELKVNFGIVEISRDNNIVRFQ